MKSYLPQLFTVVQINVTCPIFSVETGNTLPGILNLIPPRFVPLPAALKMYVITIR